MANANRVRKKAAQNTVGFNPCNVFLHPRATVDAALAHPNPALAILFLLLPTVVALAGALLLGFAANYTNALVALGLDVAGFLAFVILAGLFARKKIAGIFTAYALTRVLTTVVVVLGVVLALLVPNAGALLEGFSAGTTSAEVLVANAGAALAASPAVLLVAVVFFFVSVWFTLLWLYLGFLTIWRSTNTTVLRAIVLLVVLSAISVIVTASLESVLLP